jgi:hypothetical protein
MTKDQIQQDKGGDEFARETAGQREEHDVRDHAIDELMNPLHTDGELQQECPKKEGEQMTHRAVREHIHDHPERVAEEESECVIECFDIESDTIGEVLNVCCDKRRDCDDCKERERVSEKEKKKQK